MQQWKRERAKGSPRSLKPLGKKAHLNRCPGKSGRWAQIPAGPVVPAQGAVLPPYVKAAPTALFGRGKPAGPVVPAQRAVLPAHPETACQRLEEKTRGTISIGPEGGTSGPPEKACQRLREKTRRGGTSGKKTGTSGVTVVPGLLPV